MNAWYFIVGAYVVTAIAIVAEVLAVRARHRAALRAADESRSSRKTGPA
jgi:Heme exporter protein D (CcmD)